MEKQTVINNLLKAGAKQVENLIVKNCRVKALDTYIRVSLTCDKEVDAFVADKENPGTYVKGKNNIIFVSLYNVTSAIKDNEDASFMANSLLRNPTGCEVLLSHAKLTIIQEEVAEGTDYHNPWSSDEDNVTHFNHDTIINHLISVEISENSKDLVKQAALAILGVR